MEAHLNGNHSIAYYAQDNTFLGDATWPVPSPTVETYNVCASGPAADSILRTVCCDANRDEEFCIGFEASCIVATGPDFVVDACYSE